MGHVHGDGEVAQPALGLLLAFEADAFSGKFYASHTSCAIFFGYPTAL